MSIFSKVLTGSVIALMMFSGSSSVFAASAVGLGSAGDFAVLGGSTITNTGSTVVNGDLGLNPGTSVTGFPPGTVNGTQHITDTQAAQAQSDLVTAYNNASGQTVSSTVTGDLGGQTLTPGVYNSASTLDLTGTLTLDGQGNADSVFIFQAGSALTTASGSSVSLTNGTQACNVFWQVSTSATLGTNSNFSGTLMALTSVTATTGATINGRVLARNGAVTLDTNTVNRPTCAAAVVPPTPVPTLTPILTPVTPPAAPTPVVPGLPKAGVGFSQISNLPWQAPVMIILGLATLFALIKTRQTSVSK